MSNGNDTHSKTIGYILWIFGFTGSHRFYYGYPGLGTIYFLRISGKNKFYCLVGAASSRSHRWDFETTAENIRAFLDGAPQNIVNAMHLAPE